MKSLKFCENYHVTETRSDPVLLEKGTETCLTQGHQKPSIFKKCNTCETP